MATTAEPIARVDVDRAVSLSARVLTEIGAGYPENFEVRLWNGQSWQPSSGPTPFTLVLHHPGALRAMLWSGGAVQFGESYIFNDFDVEGDMLAFSRWMRHLVERSEALPLWRQLRVFSWLTRLPRDKRPRQAELAGSPTKGDHRIARDREAVSYTYNVPPEVYRLFLDDNMQYTCGYFSSPDEDVDAAQLRKMDYICRKLRLKPGERYVDFGCGWSNLLIHAAKNYGVEGVGVTLSEAQARYAEKLIAEAGLKGRVSIELCDYREFRPKVQFDKASSVGMGEHIGHKNLPVFFHKVFECLKPGGAYFHQTINIAPGKRMPKWTKFSHKYVFPNGEMQSILFVLQTAASAGFEIRDVENLREHYVHTLESWVHRLEANREEIVRRVGEVRYRIFRLYMAGATMGFRHGVYNLTHSLVVKSDHGRAGLPLTRADWYA